MDFLYRLNSFWKKKWTRGARIQGRAILKNKFFFANVRNSVKYLPVPNMMIGISHMQIDNSHLIESLPTVGTEIQEKRELLR